MTVLRNLRLALLFLTVGMVASTSAVAQQQQQRQQQQQQKPNILFIMGDDIGPACPSRASG